MNTIQKEQITERLTIRQTLALHGIKTTDKGNISCPFHKDETPSFSIIEDKAFICFSCNRKGDIFALDMELRHCDFVTSLNELAKVAGVEVTQTPATTAEKPDWHIDKVAELLESCDHDKHRVRKYLASRGLDASLADLENVWESTGYYAETKQTHKAMVMPIYNVTGELLGVRAIYLATDNDDKAPGACKRPYKLTDSTTLTGSHIPLADLSGDTLCIAEGIETAMAIYQVTKLPVWAAGDANMLRAMVIPDSIKTVQIWGDNDASKVGQNAATDLQKRLQKQGITVEVFVPSETDTDWLDCLVKYGSLNNAYAPKQSDPYARFKQPVKDEEIEQIIADCALAPLVDTFCNMSLPALPIGVGMAKSLALVSTVLCKQNAMLPCDLRGIERATLRIDTAGGQALNFWTLLVAGPSCGKDMGTLLDKIAPTKNLGNAGSGEGIIDKLIETDGVGMLIINEFENWLDKNRWQSDARSTMTGLFSSGNYVCSLSKRSGGAIRDLPYAFFGVAANVQPGILNSKLERAAVESGFMPRFFVCIGDDMIRTPLKIDIKAKKARMKNCLDAYDRMTGVIDVPEDYLQDMRDWANNEKPAYRAHLGRLINEYGPRLAFVLSVKENDMALPKIQPETWSKVERLLIWFYQNYCKTLGEAKIENSGKTLRQRFAKYVEREKRVSASDVAKFVPSDPEDRKRELQNLVDMGAFEVEIGKRGGRTYFWTGDVPLTEI